MKWITTLDIREWPDRKKRHSEENVPVLLRKLIYASIDKEDILELDITGGDSILYSGYDGYANIIKGNSFLPSGKIVFEIGTDDAIKGKADNDYNGRTNNPGEIIPSETTFIFVTPRLFSNGRKWADEKRKEGIWVDVRVINATLLEQWLEYSPSVGEWMAKELLLRFPSDVIGLNTFWESKFPNDTDIKIHPNIVLGGRENETLALLERCSFEGATIISCDSSNESIYFIVATLINSDESEKFTSRTVIISTEQHISSLLSIKERLIIIPTYYNREVIDALITVGHTVIIPIDKNSKPERYISIDIESTDEREFDHALELSGFNREKVRLLAGQSLRDVNVLRYILEYENTPPDWSSTDNLNDVIPLLLINSWDESYEIDRWALEELSKRNYKEDISKVVARFKDTLIKKADNKHFVSSPKLVFHLLKKKIPDLYFENFKGIAVNILTDINPFVKMSDNERFMAQYYGKKANCSRIIKKGLCHTLIFISKSDSIINRVPAKVWVDNVIAEVLQSDNTDVWKTLDDVLDLLVEASPEVFLYSLDHNLNNNTATIKGVFVVEQSFGLFNNHYHNSLLWALEKTAWNIRYFEKSISCLIKLASIDPGGSTINRPINSLKGIYSPWLPQTFVNAEIRIKVLSKFVIDFSNEVFEICKSILNYNGTVFPNEKPYFESDNLEKHSESYADMHLSQKGAFEIVNKIDNISENDLISLLWSIYKVFKETKILIIQLIKERANKEMTELWESLGRLISGELSERRNRDQLDSDTLGLLKDLHAYFAPEDPFIKVQRWFNDPWTYILFEQNDLKEDEIYDEDVKHKIRVSIVKELIDSHGLDTFVKKSKLYKLQYYVGNTIADLLHTDDSIITYFKSNLGDNLNPQAVSGFAYRKVYNEGLEWAFKYFKKLMNLRFVDSYAILSGLHTKTEVIDFIEDQTDEDKDFFWRYCSPIYPEADEKQSLLIINGLEKTGRIHHLFFFLNNNREKIKTRILLDTLLNFGYGKFTSTDNLQVDSFKVKSLLKELQSREDKDNQLLLTLELMFFDIFDEYSNKMPKTINYALSTDPAFVLELLTYTFKPEKGDTKQQYEEKNEMNGEFAFKMYKIWSSWDKFVDKNGDRVVIDDQTKLFISKSRELAQNASRLTFLDSKFGEILASFLINVDQSLNTEVMGILQEINSSKMFSSFEARLYNGPSGAYFSSMDGGKTELGKAKKYRDLAAETRFEYSIVAACFERIADSFERSAQHWKLRSIEMKLER